MNVVTFVAKGILPAEPESNTRFSLYDLVSILCKRLNMPADRVWAMSVSDIFLTLRELKEAEEAATTQTEQKVMLLNLQQRWDRLDKLTIEERIELEDLIAEYT